ncbi:hypothetical protein ILUMI_13433 [Ignelater luminosus]|uniref:Uncharacterized protein n=1 Tax=Ignelater luminosus TaxID=2038154 RepID=A0A8K0CWR5_IGNLU|nr:hypothetical protein ILUMI_13433 [Ignelater luminosus]
MATVSPMDVRPLSKAGLRKNVKHKTMKSAILTSTSVKKAIRLEQTEKNERKKFKEEKAKKKLFELPKSGKQLKPEVKARNKNKKVEEENSEDCDEDCLFSLHETLQSIETWEKTSFNT